MRRWAAAAHRATGCPAPLQVLVSPTVGTKTVDTAPASWSAPGTVRPYAGRTWRDNLLAATSTLPKRLGGDTGLYDTTAAAYAKMVAEYDARYVNSVVIMTDGKNDDPGGGLSLDQLLATLRATSRGDRPVRVITIGMGEADPRSLTAISKATGGTSYIANTPADIQRDFVQALLARNAK